MGAPPFQGDYPQTLGGPITAHRKRLTAFLTAEDGEERRDLRLPVPQHGARAVLFRDPPRRQVLVGTARLRGEIFRMGDERLRALLGPRPEVLEEHVPRAEPLIDATGIADRA